MSIDKLLIKLNYKIFCILIQFDKKKLRKLSYKIFILLNIIGHIKK